MKLMVLDGNSIINRAFYGIRPLTTKDGLHTNGVYGFLTILRKLVEEEKPDALCVTFDLPGPTARHERYEQYKAQRKGMPDELAEQMPVIKQVLDAMNIPRFELSGWEADDLIGTISKKCEAAGWDCLIVTGDKDSFQLITQKTHVRHVKTRMGQTETIEYDRGRFFEEYGFEPEGMIELKALMGDASDNIPGVAGVGEKTAMALIRKFKTVDGVYENLDDESIKPAARRKLEDGREQAYMSLELATICTGLELEFAPEDCVLREPDKQELLKLFLGLEFNKFIEQWGLFSESEAVAGVFVAPEEHTLKTVTALVEVESLAEMWKSSPYVALVALPGLDGVAVKCGGDKETSMAYLMHTELGGDYRRAMEILFAPGIKKVTHNLKALSAELLREGLPVEDFIFDTELAAYLLRPTDGGGYPISKLMQTYLDAASMPESVYASPDAFSPLADRDAAMAAWMGHTSGVRQLYEKLRPELEGRGMLELLERVELPLAAILSEMEAEGFLVDRNALNDFGQKLSGRITELEQSVYSYAGEEFNINSTKQLGTILFEKLNLPFSKKTKTGYSTNIDVLQKLRGKHPIIEEIIEYRQLAKLKGTYADGLLKVIAPDGRIHTSFMMTVTATGRLSSAEPNLQNIPVRTELGREIRKMFTAGDGRVLVDADYSQIELRLLAHISGDETMRCAFASGEDIHTVTASQVFGVPFDDVTPLMRSRAKAVNFGIVYGISAWSLAEDIGVFPDEAKAYIDAYLEKYHGVREYMKSIVEQARRDGYVTTLMGRRRDIPELKSSNFNLRSFGERVALNTPIQGSAADIIKMAMVNADGRLKREGLRSKLIMQVHDELIVEAWEDEAEKVAILLAEEMENVMELSIPLTAEAKTGKTWFDAK